jgi:branched-chain amino acid transport system substrate-binding protein
MTRRIELAALALEHVLKACCDDLSTENILKQAYAIKDLELPMLLPGIKINTRPTDHVPVDQMQFSAFNWPKAFSALSP